MVAEWDVRIGKTYWTRAKWSRQMVTAQVLTYKTALWGGKRFLVEYTVLDYINGKPNGSYKKRAWKFSEQLLVVND